MGVCGVWVRTGVDEEDCVGDLIKGEEHTFSFEEWLEGCIK